MVATQEKQVMLEFNYMSVERKKKLTDTTAYDMNAIVDVMSKVFAALMQKPLLDRKHDFSSKEKTIWLDSLGDLGGGKYDLVFKSAKYNQSRNVINTETMTERGRLKEPVDGDEEKTHLCIRLGANQDRFVTINERNYYGVSISEIKWYLNQQLEGYHVESGDTCAYSVSFDIILSKEFLVELRKMNKINVLRLTVEKRDSAFGDFFNLAGRDSIRDTVDITIHKKRGKGNDIPIDLIETYFKDTGKFNRIKKISVEGANKSGNLKIDTDSIQLKHSITVGVIAPTNEVDSNQFFLQAQRVVNQLRG